MHLGTLEVSLKVFDEELCWGFSRVCDDCQMIRLQDWKKMRTWLWKWGIWQNCIELGIPCGQRDTSSDANIAQVDYVLVWPGEFRDKSMVCGVFGQQFWIWLGHGCREWIWERKNVCGMVSKIVVEWRRLLEAADWANIQVSKVPRRRARIQLNITSQEEEDESSMIDWRKKRRRIWWSRTKSDRRVYEEQEMWRDRECWTDKKMEWFEMTDIKEKIAWIWWKCGDLWACSCLYVYVVSRRQRRENRIVRKLMMGDNRRESIVEKLPLESEVKWRLRNL